MAGGILSGQVAIVTGSAINTGAVIAATLARAGAAVASVPLPFTAGRVCRADTKTGAGMPHGSGPPPL